MDTAVDTIYPCYRYPSTLTLSLSIAKCSVWLPNSWGWWNPLSGRECPLVPDITGTFPPSGIQISMTDLQYITLCSTKINHNKQGKDFIKIPSEYALYVDVRLSVTSNYLPP